MDDDDELQDTVMRNDDDDNDGDNDNENSVLTDAVLQGDCVETLEARDDIAVDGVITSPPYNLGTAVNRRAAERHRATRRAYGVYVDDMPAEQYVSLLVRLFGVLERRVREDGAVCLNLGYSSRDASLPFRTVCAIEAATEWRLMDTIAWKKRQSLPMPSSACCLSRLVEFVFVFARERFRNRFRTNRARTGRSSVGQTLYRGCTNLIEAANNDGRGALNVSFSSELVTKLLDMYFPKGSIVLDPFMGAGTTATACLRSGRHYVGIDLDKDMVKRTLRNIALASGTAPRSAGGRDGGAEVEADGDAASS